jgi:hypothetical protein
MVWWGLRGGVVREQREPAQGDAPHLVEEVTRSGRAVGVEAVDVARALLGGRHESGAAEHPQVL